MPKIIQFFFKNTAQSRKIELHFKLRYEDLIYNRTKLIRYNLHRLDKLEFVFSNKWFYILLHKLNSIKH